MQKEDHANSFEITRTRKPFNELTLLDRFLFDTAMSIPDVARNILSIIMGEDLPEIAVGISERSIEPYYDSRAIRLDLLAIDENDVVYDAEAQPARRNKSDYFKRSRFYQGVIDASLLKPGEIHFSSLNDLYIIFISPYDLFGAGRYRYTFKPACREIPGLFMDDGAVRIFLNTKGTVDEDESPELIEFLHMMESTLQEDYPPIRSPKVSKLAGQIRELKQNQKVGVKYMRFLEELEEEKAIAREKSRAEGLAEGRAEGRAEERENGISKLISSSVKLGANDEKILSILGEEYGLSEKEAAQYLQKYKKG